MQVLFLCVGGPAMYLTQLKDQGKKGFKLYFVVVNKYIIYIYIHVIPNSVKVGHWLSFKLGLHEVDLFWGGCWNFRGCGVERMSCNTNITHITHIIYCWWLNQPN